MSAMVGDQTDLNGQQGHGLISLLVGFGRALRAEGLSVGSGDIRTYCEAMTDLDPTDLLDLYWAGRACLLTRREDIETFDEVFRWYFLSVDSPLQDLLQLKAETDPEGTSALELPPLAESGEEEEEEGLFGLEASNIEVLKQKAFSECTPEEHAMLRRLMERFKLLPPRRKMRRSHPANSGSRLDMSRTIRRSLRTQGEFAELCWRQRKVRRRPLVLILDISGSMAEYSRALLQFSYSANRASDKVEVFCFGTHLTRITDALETRDPDTAIEEATQRAFDWEGGTRIGDSLDTFVREWGRKGTGRGSVAVICSDGLDRGDPEVLSTAMERLSRLCHRIVWMNPHKGDDPNFQAQSVGMMIVQPYVDVILSGHDLRSLEELAEVLPHLG